MLTVLRLIFFSKDLRNFSVKTLQERHDSERSKLYRKRVYAYRGNSGELHSRQAKIGVRENCEMFCSLSVKRIAAEL